MRNLTLNFKLWPGLHCNLTLISVKSALCSGFVLGAALGKSRGGSQQGKGVGTETESGV